MISEEAVKVVSTALINLKMYKGTDTVIVACHLIKCRIVDRLIGLAWGLVVLIIAGIVLRTALKSKCHEERVACVL